MDNNYKKFLIENLDISKIVNAFYFFSFFLYQYYFFKKVNEMTLLIQKKEEQLIVFLKKENDNILSLIHADRQRLDLLLQTKSKEIDISLQKLDTMMNMQIARVDSQLNTLLGERLNSKTAVLPAPQNTTFYDYFIPSTLGQYLVLSGFFIGTLVVIGASTYIYYNDDFLFNLVSWFTKKIFKVANATAQGSINEIGPLASGLADNVRIGLQNAASDVGNSMALIVGNARDRGISIVNETIELTQETLSKNQILTYNFEYKDVDIPNLLVDQHLTSSVEAIDNIASAATLIGSSI